MSKNEKRQIKYAYLRDERDPRRVMTIARKWGKKGNKIHYGFTICNPVEDQFRKATGRDESVRRMSVNPMKIRPVQGEFILRAVIEDIAYRARGEDRARNALVMANQWLEENDRRMEEDYLRLAEQDDNDFEGCETNCGECRGCDCEAGVGSTDEETVELDDSEQEERLEKIQAIRKNLGGGPLAYGRPSSSNRRYD